MTSDMGKLHQRADACRLRKPSLAPRGKPRSAATSLPVPAATSAQGRAKRAAACSVPSSEKTVAGGGGGGGESGADTRKWYLCSVGRRNETSASVIMIRSRDVLDSIIAVGDLTSGPATKFCKKR